MRVGKTNLIWKKSGKSGKNVYRLYLIRQSGFELNCFSHETILLLLLSCNLFAQKQVWVNYDQETFDSDTCCWRKLSKAGEFQKSADVIVAYLKEGKTTNRQSLNWHAGQMFAFAGDNQNALKYFGKTYNVFYKWFGGEDGKTWYYFAKGTSAFIKRDKPKLEKIIAHWKRKFSPDNNFKELTLLLKNWDEGYEAATKPK